MKSLNGWIVKKISLALLVCMILALTSCVGEKTGVTAKNPTITEDREGSPITLPENIEKIISMGPSNTEVLAALGCGDKIIAADKFSVGIPGISEGIPLFSMEEPDGEQIIGLEPDIVIVTGMSKSGGMDPFKVVSDTGICVIYIPSSSSIESIKEDIRFISEIVNLSSEGEEIVSDMEQEIKAIEESLKTAADKKSVYFEISAAPYMYSFGSETFLNELINIIGGENIFSSHEGWIAVSDEEIFKNNPEIIFTSVNYIDNPVEEIKSRPGWDQLNAVKNNRVYYINTDASNRPSHNIVKALKEMAAAVAVED